MAGPLEGIRILEFTEIIAGPFGGMLLGDMGADIIKIEPPWGEAWRFSNEFIPSESRTYISLNRGKRSLPLDLTKPEGRDIVYKLLADTDVVIVNYRPDVPHKLGIDYNTLSARNPRLIYCENTAFGRQGPDSRRPGYDIVVQAMSGIMASEGKVRNGVPQQVQSTAIADYATGIAIAWGVCGALFHRERTGRGQKIEATLLATALGVQTDRFLRIAAVDDEPRAELLEDLGTLRTGGVEYDRINERYQQVTGAWSRQVFYRTYQASDGVLAVGCLSGTLRRRLLDVLGLEGPSEPPGYERDSDESRAFVNELREWAEAVFRRRSVGEWLALLDRAGVPAGPVRFVEELTEDEQVVANDLVVELKHSLAEKLKMVGPLISMSDSPLEAKSASPGLGEHASSILEGLGYPPEEVELLRAEGITR